MGSHRCTCAVCCTHRYISSRSSLKRILILTGNQQSSYRTGVMWSNWEQRVTVLAATFWRRWRLLISLSGRTVLKSVANSPALMLLRHGPAAQLLRQWVTHWIYTSKTEIRRLAYTVNLVFHLHMCVKHYSKIPTSFRWFYMEQRQKSLKNTSRITTVRAKSLVKQ